MIVQRRSILTQKVNTMNLNVTEEQLIRQKQGEIVQDVFPELSADEREFLISGITPEEWSTHIESSNL